MRGSLADSEGSTRLFLFFLLFVASCAALMPRAARADDIDLITYEPTFRAEHAGISIYNGNPEDIFVPPEIATIRSSALSAVNGSWIIEELQAWGHDVPSERGVYVIERINPATGNLEGGTAVRGQNYDVAHVAFSASATTTYAGPFSLPNLGADGTPSGRYKIFAVEYPETKSVYDPETDTNTITAYTDEDVGEFLARGPMNAGIYAPVSYSMSAAQFDYVADGSPPCTEKCYSNVLFLPGIKASRLYKQKPPGCMANCEDQLWEPNTDSDVEDLFLNSDGTSIRDDIYTRDILDTHLSTGNGDVYGTFATFMGNEVKTGVIKDWAAVPYDWRLDLEHVVENGTSLDGHISYIGMATSSYAMNQVFNLASSSKSGKVTIVAHSNGGLFTKILMSKLKETGKENLVDKIIFVGVPQTGTPKAIATLLHGYKEAILSGLITKTSTARILAGNTPEAYNLLPSQEYFHDVATPPILFPADTKTAQDFRAAYGGSTGSYQSFRKFLLGLEGRSKPSADETNLPDVLNYDLLTQAEALHTKLDAWTPPDGVEFYEVAGVGLETPSGIKYVDECPLFCLTKGPYLNYAPEMIIEGDGTVVGASALAGTGTKYYFNIADYNRTHAVVNHASIMGASNVDTLIDKLIRGDTDSLPSLITTTAPVFANAKHLIYRVHSPVSLDLYDSSGNHTGIATTTQSDGTIVSFIENNVAGTYYDEFGEVKYIFSDGSEQVNIVLNGLGSGVATFDIEERLGNTSVASTTFVNIPVEPQTIISMSMSAGGTISGASNLDVDENGDGTVDSSYASSTGKIIVPDVPVAESTPVESAPTMPAPTVGGGGGIPSLLPQGTPATTTSSISSEQASSTIVATTTIANTIATTSTLVATDIPEIKRLSIQTISRPRAPVQNKQSTQQKGTTSTNSARLVAGAAASLPTPASSPTGERWWSGAYKVAKSIIRFIIGL
ncbi:MAG: hypothetical protein Q7S05_00980 [bacterium]|nr:hypothetical protein [bacterium]